MNAELNISVNRNRVLQQWVRVSLLNLLIVALLGAVMRYKITWSLPIIDQKNFLHAHSHFAFAGWITMLLMVLMIDHLVKKQEIILARRYKWILAGNLICAYGMLFTFPVQGYGLYSIIFSTLSIFISYAFAIMYWKDLNRIMQPQSSHCWFKAALIFNVISSLGAFSLAWMMATKNVHQNWYLQAVYFFLHFQYNGWFFFACMGLLVNKLISYNIPQKKLVTVFWLFAVACIPAYILSVLWVKIPVWMYVLVVMSAFAQVAGLVILITQLFRFSFFNSFTSPAKYLLILSGVSLIIKLLLQLGSTIPFLSHLAYGFRPIVIAYLHLVLLGMITLFLLAYVTAENYMILNKLSFGGIFIFTAGVVANEIILMIQGIGNLNYTFIPYLNEMLFVAAVIMLSGMLLIISSQRRISKRADLNHIL